MLKPNTILHLSTGVHACVCVCVSERVSGLGIVFTAAYGSMESLEAQSS